MRVYLVRHGETEGNVKAFYQTAHTPLSQTGFKQTQSLAARFKSLPVDVVYASPYERTRQTAQEVKKIVQKEINFADDLKEIVRPTEFHGKSLLDPYVLEVKEQMSGHADEPNWHYSDEENFFDWVNRAKRVIEMLNSLKDKYILLITHEGFMKVLIAAMMFGDDLTPNILDDLYSFLRIKNTGITIVEKQDGNWRLITWNDHAHLG